MTRRRQSRRTPRRLNHIWSCDPEWSVFLPWGQLPNLRTLRGKLCLTNGQRLAPCFPQGNKMNISETTSRASAGLHRAQEHMEGLGRTAGEALDEARHETDAKLESAASTVRTTGRYGAETIESLSGSAAGKLDSTAAYVRG